jgi:hypothetical protein
MTQDYSDYPGPEFMFNIRVNIPHRFFVYKFKHVQKWIFIQSVRDTSHHKQCECTELIISLTRLNMTLSCHNA